MGRGLSERRWRWAGVMFLAAWCAAAGPAAGAGDPPPEARFPSRLIQGEKAGAARFFLKDYTLFRERRTEYRSNLRVYNYLLERLPLASDMMRVLKFGKYKVAKRPDGSHSIDTGTGVTGGFWLVYDGEGRKIIYAEGGYSGWLIRRLGGRATFTVSYEPARTDKGLVMRNHLMVFVKVDNVIVDFLIKTLDWMIRLLVRRQIGQASSAARKLAEAIAQEPGKVYERLKKSLRIPPPALKEFRDLFLGGKPDISSAPPAPPGSDFPPRRASAGRRRFPSAIGGPATRR